jgi:hypothetical protein
MAVRQRSEHELVAALQGRYRRSQGRYRRSNRAGRTRLLADVVVLNGASFRLREAKATVLGKKYRIGRCAVP